MKPQAGFTLVELLVTMVVAGILMTVAIPNFKTTIANNRQSAQLNTLLSGLIYTRSEAIKRNVKVVICSTNDQATCSGNWTNGWLVYYTPASTSTTVSAPTAAEIIRQYPALGGSNTLKSDANAASNTVIFQANGMTSMAADSQFTLCDSRGTSYARLVMVSATGRAQVLSAGTTAWGSTTLTISCP